MTRYAIFVLDSFLTAKVDRRFRKTSGGIRMAPNLTKIMYHWGLRKELQAIAVNSQAIDMLLCACWGLSASGGRANEHSAAADR